MRRWQARSKRSRGFTLIELVAVMVIISILVGALAINIGNRIEFAKRTRALQDVKTIETAVDLYAADNGSPPTTQQGLDALKAKPNSPPVPKNWNGPYFKKAAIDPWGQKYVYQCPGQINPNGYDVISYGKDEKPGGTDELSMDITNSDEE